MPNVPQPPTRPATLAEITRAAATLKRPVALSPRGVRIDHTKEA